MSYVLAVLAILVGFLLVYRYPDGAEKTLTWLLTIRRYVFGALLLMAGVVLLGTGNFFYMLTGFAIFVLATVYVLTEEPYKEAKSWLTN